MKVEIYSIDEIRAAARDARKAQGLTQARAAGLSGLTRKWLSDFERGHTDPPLSLALRLLITLGLKVNLESYVVESAQRVGIDDSGDGL